jgi:hypothetical protein
MLVSLAWAEKQLRLTEKKWGKAEEMVSSRSVALQLACFQSIKRKAVCLR